VLDGTPRVQILLHKENLAAYDKFEIKQYITEDIFNIDDPADIDFTPNEFGKGPFDRYEENMDRQPENVNNGSEGRIILLTILIGLFVMIYIIVGRKHSSVMKARETLDQIQWARQDWILQRLK